MIRQSVRLKYINARYLTNNGEREQNVNETQSNAHPKFDQNLFSDIEKNLLRSKKQNDERNTTGFSLKEYFMTPSHVENFRGRDHNVNPEKIFAQTAQKTNVNLQILCRCLFRPVPRQLVNTA